MSKHTKTKPHKLRWIRAADGSILHTRYMVHLTTHDGQVRATTTDKAMHLLKGFDTDAEAAAWLDGLWWRIAGEGEGEHR